MRSRNLKPGFFVNEELAGCSVQARLLFAGLWLMADREGRMEYRPLKIKAAVFPCDNFNIEELLGELDRAKGLITIYEANGAKYLSIDNFAKHQRPHPNEPASSLPTPPGGRTKQPARACHVYFIQHGEGGPIKIGYSDKPETRHAELQIGTPVRLIFLGSFPGTMQDEKAIHERFAAQRVDGEWFTATPELLTFVGAECQKPSCKNTSRGAKCAKHSIHHSDKRESGIREGEGSGEGQKFPVALDVPEFHLAWAEWVSDRKQRRKPLTPLAISRQLGECEKLGLTNAIAMIDMGINRGWSGLKADWFHNASGRVNGNPATGPDIFDKHIERLKREQDHET